MFFNKSYSSFLLFLFLIPSFILTVLPLSGATISAIYEDSETELPDKIRQRLEHMNTHYPQEKLYIHTDKSHYVLGETIWFRIYLSDAQTHLYSPYSNVAYVELSDVSGNWYERRYIFLEGGKGHGDFMLGTDMDQGSYVLRAYTNGWRRFRWSDLLSGLYPDIRYHAEKSYGFSGVVKSKDALEMPVRSRVFADGHRS